MLEPRRPLKPQHKHPDKQLNKAGLSKDPSAKQNQRHPPADKQLTTDLMQPQAVAMRRSDRETSDRKGATAPTRSAGVTGRKAGGRKEDIEQNVISIAMDGDSRTGVMATIVTATATKNGVLKIDATEQGRNADMTGQGICRFRDASVAVFMTS